VYTHARIQETPIFRARIQETPIFRARNQEIPIFPIFPKNRVVHENQEKFFNMNKIFKLTNEV